MGVEAEFLRLRAAFEAMRDALHGVGLTVIEDRPPHDEVLLVERLGNLVEDLQGWCAEGLAASVEAQDAVTHPFDSYRACRALGAASGRFFRAEYRFVDEAVSYQMINELSRFGRRRGGEWLGWSSSVVTAFHDCRGPMRTLDESILRAWQELSERLCSGAVSLQNTNIGQQFVKSQTERSSSRQASYETGLEPR